MQKRNHKTLIAAEQELLQHGFWVAHTRPGTPQRWQKKNRPTPAYAVQRETRDRSTVWHIVDYPEQYPEEKPCTGYPKPS